MGVINAKMYKKHLQLTIDLLMTYSFLVFLFNFIKFTHFINTVFYLTLILCFVISTAMVFFYPYFYYNNYKDLFFGYIEVYSMNALCLITHAYPIHMFKDEHTIDELFDIDIILASALLTILYYIAFRSILYKLYPFNDVEIIVSCGIFYLLFMIYGQYNI